MRERKYKAWHRETKQFLNIWPYDWQKGLYAGTSKENRFFNNEFELTPDGLSCNRITGKSVFFTLDGTIVGVVPISETITQTVDYSDEYDVLEFTGLKDKNGVEIYEGDIVKITTPHGYSEVGQIVYKDISARFGFLSPDDSIYGLHTDDPCNEVIGNIYTNPELLNAV